MFKRFTLVLLLFTILPACNKKKQFINPKVQDLTESVYSSVTIQPDSLYHVYSMVSGILDKNLVEEGDEVEKNQPIIQIINNTPKLNIQNAKLALDLAKENYKGKAAILDAIVDEIDAAELQYKNDSINFFRQKNLWDQNIGSKVDYDSKKLQYQLSINKLITLKSKYQRTKNELETALKQAENNYQSTLITNQDFTISSKINGKVYALFKDQGEIVTTMDPIASIGSSNLFLIEMLVDEVDIIKIKLDQDVLVTLDAYENKVFEAKVSKIYPEKNERNQTFMIEALFANAPKTLYPGLSGEANIIIDVKSNVLTIPKDYLLEGNKVKTDDGYVTVRTGIENLESVEVISGLSEKTKIYNPKE